MRIVNAQRLIHRREELGLSQRDLADRLNDEAGPAGVPGGFYYSEQWLEYREFGTFLIRSKDNVVLLELAHCLETTQEWLLDPDPPPFQVSPKRREAVLATREKYK